MSKSDNYLLYTFLNSKYTYSQQSCISMCLQLHVIEKCNCSHPSISTIFNATVCEAKNLCYLTVNFLKEKDFIQKNCLKLCPLECEQHFFETKISSLKMISWKHYLNLINQNFASYFSKPHLTQEKAIESFISLNIFYESLSFTLTTEKPQMDLVALLASVGGNLSLFLGVSVFSVCELIEVLIEIYFIKKNSLVE